MRPKLWHALTLLALSVGSVAPLSAQAEAGFTWRLSMGVDRSTIETAGPRLDDGQTATGVRVALERAVTDRLAVGLEWTGAWYESTFGDAQRQAVTLTGSARLWRGLTVRAGAGPGVASWLAVEEPGPLPGDVVISGFGGKAALALTAGAAYNVAVGPFEVGPGIHVVAHRLYGTTVYLSNVGVRLGLRAP